MGGKREIKTQTDREKKCVGVCEREYLTYVQASGADAAASASGGHRAFASWRSAGDEMR